MSDSSQEKTKQNSSENPYPPKKTLKSPSKDSAESARSRSNPAQNLMAIEQYNLAILYKNGKGVKKDIKETVRLYKLAAEQGLADAQYNLAISYENGRGVEKDIKEAVRLYKLAAKQGLAAAQFNLAVSYENGEGVEKDFKEAARLYKLAAEQGLAESQHELAHLYDDIPLEPNGVPKLFRGERDMKEAIRLFTLATNSGRKKFEITNNPDHPLKALASKEIKDKEGIENSGNDAYQNGISAHQSRNYTKALDYFTQAATLGNPQARKLLERHGYKGSFFNPAPEFRLPDVLDLKPASSGTTPLSSQTKDSESLKI